MQRQFYPYRLHCVWCDWCLIRNFVNDLCLCIFFSFFIICYRFRWIKTWKTFVGKPQTRWVNWKRKPQKWWYFGGSLNGQRGEFMRKLAKEAWFAKHREAETLDLSIRDMMLRLCVVVEEAKQLNADEAAQYIINFKQSVLLSVVNYTFQKYSQYQYIYFHEKKYWQYQYQ